ILLMAWFKDLQGAMPALLSLLCVFGVARWISHIARSLGDQIEIALFRRWGGKPTTTMLRVALNYVDKDELLLFNVPAPDQANSGWAQRRRKAMLRRRVLHLLQESPRGDYMQKLIEGRNGPKFPGKEADK